MKAEEIAKSIFARNPEIKELHITADGQAFRELHAAESHAQRSKDQKIASIKRDGKAKEQTPDADPDKSFAAKAQKVAKATKVKDMVNPDSPAAAAQKANDTDADAEGTDATEDNALEAILDGNVKTVSGRVAEIDKVETLDALAELETAKGETSRKGVHEAITARKEAITNPKED